MEMRTGKTKTILDEFGELEAKGEIQHLLVVAPAGVYRTWKVDAEKHLSDELAKRVKLLLWDSKDGPAAREKLASIPQQGGPKILLMNIEALSTVEFAQALCARFIKAAPTMMVIDESTVIKSGKANRTKFCLAAAPHCKRRRILSGLPTPQSPLDIYTQFNFLDKRIFAEFKDLKAFQDRYAITRQIKTGNGRIIEIVSGFQRLDELQATIAKHSYRVLLKDCTDLPEKQYMVRHVELTPKQKQNYLEMKEYARTKLGNQEYVTSQNVLTHLLRLQQIVAGHTTSDGDVTVDIPENKTTEMLAILEQWVGKKAVIWATFDHDVKKIAAVLEKTYGSGCCARFWGGNRNTREADEARFKTDPKCRFMIATPASGGRGRTWDSADLVIYYTNSFNYEHRAQSEERAQAVGKKTSVLYYDLVCLDTVEEKVLGALRNKMSLSDAITGDEWKRWVV